MSLFDKALYAVINGKKTINEPIFIKDFEKENEQLKDLLELSKNVTPDKKEYIDRDIAFLPIHGKIFKINKFAHMFRRNKYGNRKAYSLLFVKAVFKRRLPFQP